MKLLQQMSVMDHERVVFHQDPESGLRAIIAIHDTTLGNALGGTRRWCYTSEADAIHDVLRLSEGMTYKAAAADLAMGGAKSVILLDDRDRKPPRPGTRDGTILRPSAAPTSRPRTSGSTNSSATGWRPTITSGRPSSPSARRQPRPFTSLGAFNAMKASLAHAGRPVDFAGLTVGIQDSVRPATVSRSS